MAELTVPRMDFSSLGNLPKVYRDAQEHEATRLTLASLGQDIQSGTVDYSKAAGRALAGGNATLGLSLLKLGEEQKERERQRKAAETAYGGMGAIFGQPTPTAVPTAAPAAAPSVGPQSGDPRGIRNNNPLNLEASSFTQRQPGFVGSDGRFGRFESQDQGMAAADQLLASYGARGINTVAGVIGRWAPANDGNPVSAYAQFVAQKAGIDPNVPINLADPAVRAKILPAMAEFENGRPVRVASLGGGVPASAAPQQPNTQTAQLAPMQAPQAQQPPTGPTINGVPIAQAVPHAMRTILNPDAPTGAKDIAKLILSKAIEVNPEIAKLEAFQRNPALMELAIQLRKAGATNVTVDQKGEGKFEEEFGKKQADRWNKYIESGDAAERKLVDITNMREISRRLGSQGAMAGLKETLGPYAEAVGLNIDGLSDIQAYTSIIQRLAPQQRAPGSGSTSDVEFKGFLKSLPGAVQNPIAREMTLDTMEALTRHEIGQAEIARKLAAGEIKRADAERELRAMPDPLKGFVEWRKANPDAYAAALKGAQAGAPSQAAPQQQRQQRPTPQPGHTEGGYRFKGGDPSQQQNWERVQ
jgi:hypothetical protein